MNYDDAEEHMKSAYLAAAKCLRELREGGLNDEIASMIVDYEFSVWSMLDRMQRTRKAQ